MRKLNEEQQKGLMKKFEDLNKDLLKKMIMRPWIMLKFRSLYNNLCNRCKNKVKANPRIGINEYCDDCQIYVVEKLEEINKGLK